MGQRKDEKDEKKDAEQKLTFNVSIHALMQNDKEFKDKPRTGFNSAYTRSSNTITVTVGSDGVVSYVITKSETVPTLNYDTIPYFDLETESRSLRRFQDNHDRVVDEIVRSIDGLHRDIQGTQTLIEEKTHIHGATSPHVTIHKEKVGEYEQEINKSIPLLIYFAKKGHDSAIQHLYNNRDAYGEKLGDFPIGELYRNNQEANRLIGYMKMHSTPNPTGNINLLREQLKAATPAVQELFYNKIKNNDELRQFFCDKIKPQIMKPYQTKGSTADKKDLDRDAILGKLIDLHKEGGRQAVYETASRRKLSGENVFARLFSKKLTQQDPSSSPKTPKGPRGG